MLATVPDGEPFDFLVGVAAELPMQMICILLGVPEGDRHELWSAVDPGFDIRTGDAARSPYDSPSDAQRHMFEYGQALIASKRAQPTDDMLSVVVHATLADVDPPALSDAELYSFFSLLFAAGSETTRNAIAGGLLALIERPAQFAAVRDGVRAGDRGVLATAIEEMLRWTTPSPSKRRTATVATSLAGHHIAPGDKVLFWEGSANRDELAFERADRVRHHPRPEPAPHVRPRAPLLPRRQPRPARDAGGVRGAASPTSPRSSWPPRSSGPAATATPASATSTSPAPAPDASFDGPRPRR